MLEEARARLPYLSDEAASPEVRQVFARLREQWQGAPVLHLYRLIGWAPGLVGPWLGFARALRFGVAVSAKLREILIVRSGQLLEAEYEWRHHWVAARDAGISEEKLNAVADWKRSELFDADERAVLALADDTATGNGASEPTMRELIRRFSTERVAELVVIAGFYSGVARIVNSFAVPLEPGFEAMVPRRGDRAS